MDNSFDLYLLDDPIIEQSQKQIELYTIEQEAIDRMKRSPLQNYLRQQNETLPSTRSA